MLGLHTVIVNYFIEGEKTAFTRKAIISFYMIILLRREITVGGIQAVKGRKLMQTWKTQLVPGVGRCLQSGFPGTWWAGKSGARSTPHTVRDLPTATIMLPAPHAPLSSLVMEACLLASPQAGSQNTPLKT